MDSEKQIKFNRFTGMGSIIAKKTGYSAVHVRDVLAGKRSRNGRKGKHIIALAQELSQMVESVTVEDE